MDSPSESDLLLSTQPDPGIDIDDTDDLLSPPITATSPKPAPPSKDRPPSPHHPFIRGARPWQVRTPRGVVRLAATVKFAVTFSGMLIMLPIYRLVQDLICHAYLHDDSPGPIDERRCEAEDAVQAGLAYFIGWMGLLGSVLTLVAASPYGTMADRVGRKFTVVFAYSGLLIQFVSAPILFRFAQPFLRRHPWFLITGTFLNLVGGGVYVIFATLYAIASDVSSEEERASNFLYLTFGSTAGGLLGPFTSGLLMEKFGPWVPIVIVSSTSPFVLALFFFLPETHPAPAGPAPERTASAGPRSQLRDLRVHVRRGLGELLSSLSLFRNPNVVLVLVTFFVANVLFSAYSATLALYITKYFGWTLAQVSYLLSPLGVLNLLVLVALPFISRLISDEENSASASDAASGRRRFGQLRPSPHGRDLFLARLSLAFQVLGAVVEGLSRDIGVFLFGLVIGTLGTAHSPLCRAVVTHHVESAHTSRLYALISMVEIVGSFFGGPLLAWWFDIGMRRGGPWTGLPWFYVAALCLVALLCLHFVREPDRAGTGGSGEVGSRCGGRVRTEEETHWLDEETRGLLIRHD